jgi:hypothetical protein
MNPVENQTFGVEAAPSRTHPEAGMDVAEKIGPVFVMAFFLPLVLGDLSEGVVVVWLETVHPVRRCVCVPFSTHRSTSTVGSTRLFKHPTRGVRGADEDIPRASPPSNPSLHSTLHTQLHSDLGPHMYFFAWDSWYVVSWGIQGSG